MQAFQALLPYLEDLARKSWGQVLIDEDSPVGPCAVLRFLYMIAYIPDFAEIHECEVKAAAVLAHLLQAGLKPSIYARK